MTPEEVLSHAWLAGGVVWFESEERSSTSSSQDDPSSFTDEDTVMFAQPAQTVEDFLTPVMSIVGPETPSQHSPAISRPPNASAHGSTIMPSGSQTTWHNSLFGPSIHGAESQ